MTQSYQRLQNTLHSDRGWSCSDPGRRPNNLCKVVEYIQRSTFQLHEFPRPSNFFRRCLLVASIFPTSDEKCGRDGETATEEYQLAVRGSLETAPKTGQLAAQPIEIPERLSSLRLIEARTSGGDFAYPAEIDKGLPPGRDRSS